TALTAAGAARKAASRSLTWHLVEKQRGFNFIDNPPRQGFNAPPLIGDQFAFTSDVMTKSGAHAGSLDATCIVPRGGNHAPGPRRACSEAGDGDPGRFKVLVVEEEV